MDLKKLYQLYNQTYYVLSYSQSPGATLTNQSNDSACAAAMALAAWSAINKFAPQTFETFSKEMSARITQ